MHQPQIAQISGVFLYPSFHSKNKDKCLILSMSKTKKQKTKPRTIKPDLPQQEITNYVQMPESLMLELEELVKKNPNRLIGCGG